MTTLNQIRSHSPCSEGWTKLLSHLNKTQGDDEPLSLITILDSNGLADAIWCLRTEPTPERTQRFALAVARRVDHLSPAAKACNDVTECYLNGTATKAELEAAAYSAYLAAKAAYSAADDSADSAYLAAKAAVRSDAAVRSYAAADAAVYAAYSAADAADSGAKAAAYAAERKAQVQIFKEIFA